MILSKEVEVTVTNKIKKYYQDLGYEITLLNQKIMIPIEHLQPKATVLVSVKCDSCEKVFDQKYQRLYGKEKHNCFECGRKQAGKSLTRNFDTEYKCEECGDKFIKNARWYKKRCWTSKNKQILCRSCDLKRIGQITKHHLKTFYGEDHPNWNPNKTEFAAYAAEVRKITEKNYIKYKNEINPNDYPRTLCGVEGGYQLDHIISVKRGFDEGMSPKKIGAKKNLQMLSWNDNRTKHFN